MEPLVGARISYSNDTRFGSWPKGLYYVAAWLQIQHLAGLGMDALQLQWEQLAFGKDLALDFWDKSISPLAGFNQLISTSDFCCEPRLLGVNWSWKKSAGVALSIGLGFVKFLHFVAGFYNLNWLIWRFPEMGVLIHLTELGYPLSRNPPSGRFVLLRR